MNPAFENYSGYSTEMFIDQGTLPYAGKIMYAGKRTYIKIHTNPVGFPVLPPCAFRSSGPFDGLASPFQASVKVARNWKSWGHSGNARAFSRRFVRTGEGGTRHGDSLTAYRWWSPTDSLSVFRESELKPPTCSCLIGGIPKRTPIHVQLEPQSSSAYHPIDMKDYHHNMLFMGFRGVEASTAKITCCWVLGWL